jgi:tyrosyl-tRNA synthetase
MNSEERLELIERNTEEIVRKDELLNLLKKNKKPVVYCGYEPSGPLHLGHFVTILKLNDLERAGFEVKILLADVHAMLNKKGDEKLK